MNAMTTQDDYGVVTDDATLTLERLLPGPIDRIWSYLIDSDLRRQWLAAGAVEEKVGAPITLTWRNDNLACPPSQRPEGASAEHSMEAEVLELDAPHLLKISWGSTGGVTFKLEQQGDEVLLTLVHHRVADRTMLMNVAAGWHAHLAILAAVLRGTTPPPFWDEHARLKPIYEQRLAD